MSYQNPAFMVAHPASLLPIAKITPRPTAIIDDDSKRALVDGRQGEAASWTSTALSGVEYSFAATVTPRINRVVIPAGHTGFVGKTFQVFSDDNTPGFPSPIQRGAVTPVTDAIIDMNLLLVTDGIDWAFQFSVNTTDVITLGELWIGEYKALTAGDGRVDPEFERSYEHDVSEDEFGGRTASLVLAPSRRKFSLLVRTLDPAGADFATLEEIANAGPGVPFWYWTPDTTDPGPYLVKLTSAVARVQKSSQPSKKIFYEVSFEMLEQVT